jgi:hypothetical protein
MADDVGAEPDERAPDTPPRSVDERRDVVIDL